MKAPRADGTIRAQTRVLEARFVKRIFLSPFFLDILRGNY